MRCRPERRRHVVYLTKNSEYHCRSGECVGVRERQSGRWRRWHAAVRCRLAGSVTDGRKLSRNVRVGARLFFEGQRMLLTSELQQTCRPAKGDIWSYAYLCTSGLIDSQP